MSYYVVRGEHYDEKIMKLWESCQSYSENGFWDIFGFDIGTIRATKQGVWRNPQLVSILPVIERKRPYNCLDPKNPDFEKIDGIIREIKRREGMLAEKVKGLGLVLKKVEPAQVADLFSARMEIQGGVLQ